MYFVSSQHDLEPFSTLLQITKFGGDPDHVVIWGESAGAGSVLQHMVSRDGRTLPPLFKAGITSSTFLPSQYLYNDTVPEVRFDCGDTYLKLLTAFLGNLLVRTGWNRVRPYQYKA